MTKIITTNADFLRDKATPLYIRYSSQLNPQPARLYIERDGSVIAGIDAEIGGAVTTADEWHGRIQVIPLSASVCGSALADWLEDNETTALLLRVVNGLKIVLDGRNQVGELSDDAAKALEILKKQACGIDQADVSTHRAAIVEHSGIAA